MRTILLALILSASAVLLAQQPPDFSGVYYPLNPFGGGGRGAGRGNAPPPVARGGPPPRPTQSAPLSDGSGGRTPNEPLLTPPSWRNGK